MDLTNVWSPCASLTDTHGVSQDVCMQSLTGMEVKLQP